MSSQTTSRARSSKAPAAPASLSASSIVDGKAQLTGTHTVTVEDEAVIHPGARLVSNYGRVTIGARSIIWERAQVGHETKPSDGDDEGPESSRLYALPTTDVTIGASCVIESGARVAALAIGDECYIGAGVSIGPGAVLGRGCRIAPKCVISPGDLLPDYTVVYGTGARRSQTPALAALRLAAHEEKLKTMKRLVKSDLAKHGVVPTQSTAEGSA